MNPQDAFERILASLHEAALDPAQWPATSALIDEACGIAGSALAVGETSGDEARVYYAGLYRRGERRPDVEREYFEVYHPHDERVPRLRRLADSQLVHVPDLYSEAERKTSFVYNEGLRRLGTQNGLNATFLAPDGLRIVWAIDDPAAPGGWQSDQIQLIQRLLPHIRHFVLVRQALGAAAAGAMTEGLLDNRRLGVLHLDRSGRVLAANDPALAILRRRDGLLDKDGALHAWLPDDNERLQKLLGRALPALWGEPPSGGSMTLRRRSGPARLLLHVSPVGDAQADFGARRAAALVLVLDPAVRPRIDPQWVAEALDLTPSEGRVAALLAEGRSVSEIAAATGHRPGYLRQLLRRVYRKQAVSGQVALAARIRAVDAMPRP